MKRSDDGPIPQLELGPHLGAFKVLYQRSGIIARMITMLSAMSAAWSTTGVLRDVFAGSFIAFLGFAVLILLLWMVVDYTVIIPSEQSFNQGQSQRPERSPLKRDTEEIINRIDELETELGRRGERSRTVADGGTEDES